MATKIAVIGSREFLEKILTVGSQVEDITIDPYIYQQPQEAAELARTLMPCDVVFFSGALPYYFAKKHLENLTLPMLILTQDEIAVAASLLSIAHKSKIPFERISIDLFDASNIDHVLSESEIKIECLNIMDFKQQMLEDSFNLERIVQFHFNLWEQGLTEVALTSVHAVYHQLQSLGVPAIRMADPQISLLRGLQTAKDQADLFKSKAAQVAVGYLSLQEPQQEQIDNLAHSLNAYIQPINQTLFIIYSTRGEMDKYRLNDFLEKWSGTILVGFGYGSTMKEADQHARIALQFAEKELSSKCGYILTEDKEMVGPFPYEHKQYSLKNDHPMLIQVAKETKLSPSNLSKIIEFSRSRQSLQFTSADLTDYLQVTRRSTERIIKKLVDNGYVKVVGGEMVYHQGRPRAIYELHLPLPQ
ncbi:transcriptional regulator [Neobacillus sp. DY30]|uniref:transcriptional regulator n=1 Tax=Neobacillus sp. DY30 TaxID=3047871 RepID=UPI0024BFFC91|nr:transcriptional regulator [Neobacillus sp. DY30]WHY01200.1 transcriptional regulator [Neobacillus sp. DY30]